jgi:hypothetical protein
MRMTNYLELLKARAWRTLIALPFFAVGLSVLKRDKDREVLAIMYSPIWTRLNSKPSNYIAGQPFLF